MKDQKKRRKLRRKQILGSEFQMEVKKLGF